MLSSVQPFSTQSTSTYLNLNAAYRCALNAVASIGQFFKNNLVMTSVVTLGGVCITGLIYYLTRPSFEQKIDLTRPSFEQKIDLTKPSFKQEIETWLKTQSLSDKQRKEILQKIMIHYTRPYCIMLDLSGFGLTSIPECIGNLVELEWLHLDNNQLESLPECIGKLKKLKLLSLNKNSLNSLPECIGNLVELEWLELDNNQLKSLPKGIARLSALKGLYLGNNQLNSLPECIDNLVELKYIFLEGNQGLDWATVPEKWREKTN